MRRLFPFLILLALLALACGASDDVSLAVTQTLMAHTVEAALTGGVAPDEPVSATMTATPEEVSPDPLPVSTTGVILNNGECFNFDDGQVVASPDAQCDLWLVASGLFRPVNGAQLSGYDVSFDPPTRSKCAGGRYEPGDLAIQTDLHMCFITNESRVGFIVVREYRGAVPFTGIVFDYWVFH